MISVSVPCSCGEFVQGKLDGDDALISCPIDIYSTVTIKEGFQEKELLSKVKRAIYATLKFHEIDTSKLKNMSIEVETPLPYGKGYATSSSEMTAAIVAVSTFFKKKISPMEVARICVEIEPTDGIMFEGIALFKHINCKLLEVIRLKDFFEIVILESKQAYDTVELRDRGLFNIEDMDMSFEFNSLIKSLKYSNSSMMDKAMYRSALLNQGVINKEYLKEIRDMALKYGAIGVNIAHSGSLIGVIFKEKTNTIDFINKFEASEYSKPYSKLRKARIINGGWIIKK